MLDTLRLLGIHVVARTGDKFGLPVLFAGVLVDGPGLSPDDACFLNM